MSEMKKHVGLDYLCIYSLLLKKKKPVWIAIVNESLLGGAAVSVGPPGPGLTVVEPSPGASVVLACWGGAAGQSGTSQHGLLGSFTSLHPAGRFT